MKNSIISTLSMFLISSAAVSGQSHQEKLTDKQIDSLSIQFAKQSFHYGSGGSNAESMHHAYVDVSKSTAFLEAHGATNIDMEGVSTSTSMSTITGFEMNFKKYNYEIKIMRPVDIKSGKIDMSAAKDPVKEVMIDSATVELLFEELEHMNIATSANANLSEEEKDKILARQQKAEEFLKQKGVTNIKKGHGVPGQKTETHVSFDADGSHRNYALTKN